MEKIIGLLIERTELDKGSLAYVNRLEKKETRLYEYDREEFVKKFAKYYLMGEKDDNCPKNLKQSCEWVETKIMSLMDKSEKWKPVDVFRILAWKLGKINHLECKDNSKKDFVYYSGWNEKELKFSLPKQSEDVVIEQFARDVIYIREEYLNDKEKIGEKKAGESVWKKLVDIDGIDGIGTVCLITLLYFITGKKFPIYDRFAMASLVSFEFNSKEVIIPKDTIIKLSPLPDKNNKEKMKGLLTGDSIYRNYCNLLDKYFGDLEYKSNELNGIDRALWVYGHFYNVKQ